MINVNQLTSELRMMPDQALQRMAMMYKNDPYIFPMVISEDMARKKMRQAAQAQAAQPQPTVRDQAIMSMGEQPAPGITALQAPNVQNMADGGIAGYEDEDFVQRSEPVVRMAGGGVLRYAEGGGKGEDAFERAVNFVLGVEGDKYVENDAGKGPSRFGILQSANKGVNVKELTRDQAKEIYRRSYWDAIGGDELAKRDPKLAMVMFDAAVNHGVGGAQQMLKRSGGDPNKLLQERSNFYDQLVSRNPNQYSQYAKGWDQRLDKLSAEIGTEAKPTRVSELSSDELAKARAGVIPGGNLTVGGKRYTYEGQRMFEPREPTVGEKVVGAGETALSFLSAIPATVVGTGISLGRAALRGEAPTEKQFAEDVSMLTYGPKTAAGQEMTEEAAKGIASVLPPYVPVASAPSRAVAAARAARQAERTAAEAAAARGVAQTPRLPPPETPRLPAPGATPEQQRAGLAALEADRAATAARLGRQQAADVAAAESAAGRAGTAAEEAARIGAQAGRLGEDAQYAADVARRAGRVGMGAAATQAGTADKKPIVPETPPPAVVPPDLTDKEKEKVIDAAQKGVKDPSKAEGWTNDDWLNFGFAMLANRSPYFMEAIGMAGLKTLSAKQERAKMLEEKELREAQKEKLKAEAAYIGETKTKSALYNRAVQLAKAEISALRGTGQFAAMTPEDVQEQTAAITRRFYNQLLQQEGFAPEAAATAPAPGNRPPLSSFQK